MKHYYLHPELWPNQGPENTNLDSMASVQLSDQQQAQIKEIFDLFDTDGGGSIDRREKDAALYALGFHPTFGSNRQVPARKSQDGVLANNSCSDLLHDDASQTITLHEFTRLMKGEQGVRNPVDAIWAAFSELSGETESHLAAQSGLVTLEGLKRACTKYHVKLNPDELNQMMTDTDIDGNGAVDKDEFLLIMSQAPWF
jgi:Ca2+-binding EF-hand superfamily protein